MELDLAPGEAYNSRYVWAKVDLDMSSVGRSNLESHVFNGFRSFPNSFGQDFRSRGNISVTRRSYKLLAVLIKSNSEAGVS